MSLGSNSVLNTLTHPQLLNSLHRAYPAVCNIQSKTDVKNADGEDMPTWTDEPLLSGLRGSLVSTTPRSERRRADLTVQTASHVLDLNDHYDDITVLHRAVVAPAVSSGQTVAYNILAVVHDSQSRQTRLEMEEVSH